MILEISRHQAASSIIYVQPTQEPKYTSELQLTGKGKGKSQFQVF